ncbi:hypothetical protein [Streptomyces chilikensis]|uniref:hypothetical protein n=1 Tax=Streptomyces chilikensis TaxID=1194079 RepID=UPI00140ACC0A|nr:hypothetical protein [Streptomyces chilikensis]
MGVEAGDGVDDLAALASAGGPAAVGADGRAGLVASCRRAVGRSTLITEMWWAFSASAGRVTFAWTGRTAPNAEGDEGSVQVQWLGQALEVRGPVRLRAGLCLSEGHGPVAVTAESRCLRSRTDGLVLSTTCR